MQRAAANVRYGLFGDRISGIDPMNMGQAGTVGVNIFETLYQYHYLKRPYTLVPLLADGMPQVSDDGLTYVIKVRSDARFDDDAAFAGGKGRPLVAADFVYSLKRVADARNASGAWGALRDRIVGLDDFRKASMASKSFDQDTPVVGLTAPDAHTLRIQLTRPWPQLTHVLATLSTAPVAREVVERYGDEVGRHPVGTGPYRLVDWQQDMRIVLERVPGWRGEPYPSEGEAGDAAEGLLADAGETMPFIDRLDFRFIAGGQPKWLMFMNGELDYNGTPGDKFDEVFGADRALSDEMKAKGIRSYVFHASYVRWIGINMADPLMAQNPDLRLAVSHGLDRGAFNRIFLTGRNDLPKGIIPPALQRPGLGERSAPHPNVVTDKAAAKKALAAAVARHGGPIPPLKLLFGGRGGVQIQVAQLLVRNMADIGLTLTVEHVDEGVDYHKVAGERGAQLIFGVGFRPAYPDAINLFGRFYSPGITTGANPFGYSNPAFDKLYDEAKVMQQSPARDALYRQMEAMLLDDLPAVPYLEYNHFFLKHDWLLNAKPHAFYGPSGMAKYQRLDTKKRAAAVKARQ